MIVKTPLRVSLLGGGTDYRQWFANHEGCTLGFAIQHYVEVELLPPGVGIDYPIAKRCAEFFGYEQAFSIKCSTTIPGCSGLGGSSAFAASLINGMFDIEGIELIKMVRAFEGSEYGVQDQYTCIYGGFVVLKMSPNGVCSSGLTLDPDREKTLEDSLLLVDTGITRRSTYKSSLPQLIAEGKLNYELGQLARAAQKGVAILCGSGDLSTLGDLLEESWILKRRMIEVDPRIDELHNLGLKAGAIGGRLLGAGDGGFMLFFVDPSRRESLQTALHEYVQVPVHVEHEGCRKVV